MFLSGQAPPIVHKTRLPTDYFYAFSKPRVWCLIPCLPKPKSQTYRILNAEDMTEVFVRQQIFGDVGKVVEVISILRRTEDIADVMFTDHFLKHTKNETMLEKT